MKPKKQKAINLISQSLSHLAHQLTYYLNEDYRSRKINANPIRPDSYKAYDWSATKSQNQSETLSNPIGHYLAGPALFL